MSEDLSYLPPGLPIPTDDGACDHLTGLPVPKLSLQSTAGHFQLLSDFTNTLVIYLYPMTGPSHIPLPDGWDQIPGARGCTPQACSFKNHYQELLQMGVNVFGMSTQSSEFQRSEKARIHLPFDLLSDEKLEFANALKLPLHHVEKLVLHKRVTLIFDKGIIAKYFYPVFPPDKNADEVVDWLTHNLTIKNSLTNPK